jgi:hypothetical protein
MKKGININITIQKSHLFILVIILVLFAGIGISFAYNSDFSSGDAVLMGHSSDEINVRISDGTIKSLQEAIDDGDFIGTGTSTWTPYEYDFGELPYDTGIFSYDYSVSNVPATAKEILVYFTIRQGQDGNDVEHTFKIYTMEGSTKYTQYFFDYEYRQNAWSFNSDNFWMPVTSNRLLYIEHISDDGGPHTGNVNSDFKIIGYR